MKKYHAQLVSLMLFFGMLTSGIAIGMEKELPELPQDVKTIIANKTLRLILDEAEKNPQLLISREKLAGFRRMLAQYVTGKSLEKYASANNIDFIITLIVANGADPNTKSYNCNTVLHLLVAALEKNSLDKEYLAALESKIKLLINYGLNINAQNNMGNTVAHDVIKAYLEKEDNGYELYMLLKFLVSLGLDLLTIENNNHQTPIEFGRKQIESYMRKTDDLFLILDKKTHWMNIIFLLDKDTANYYLKALMQLEK